MTLDEQIIVVGKLRSLEVILLERIPRQMGYSTRWLYNNADSPPFTVRQKSGRLRFSKHGLETYLKDHRNRF